jgi:hypothetical protein
MTPETTKKERRRSAFSPIWGWVLKRRRSSKKVRESLSAGTESTTPRQSISSVVDLGSPAFAAMFEDGYGVSVGAREILPPMDNATIEAGDGYPFPSVRPMSERRYSYSRDGMHADGNGRVIQDVSSFV